jgi:hypothetical protein
MIFIRPFEDASRTTSEKSGDDNRYQGASDGMRDKPSVKLHTNHENEHQDDCNVASSENAKYENTRNSGNEDTTGKRNGCSCWSMLKPLPGEPSMIKYVIAGWPVVKKELKLLK